MTRPYQLSLSENHGSVALYSGYNHSEFTSFAHVPISHVSDYYTLGDIVSAGERINQHLVNILAAVKSVSSFEDSAAHLIAALWQKSVTPDYITAMSFHVR